MDDLISRETMIDAIDSTTWYHQNRNKDIVEGASDEETAWFKAKDVFKAIENVPSAQPKKGKWIHGKEIAREYLGGETIHIEYKDYHCSECGYTVANIRWNVDGELVDRYCTSCGAQMEVEKDE